MIMVVVRQYTKEGEGVFCIGHDATDEEDSKKGITYTRLLAYTYCLVRNGKTIEVRNEFATKEEAEAAINEIYLLRWRYKK